MASAKRDIFIPSVKRREVPHRGRLRSREVNSTNDEIIADFSRISKVLNNLSTRFDKRMLELEAEQRHLQALVQQQLEERSQEDLRRAVAGEDIVYYQSFRDLRGLLFDDIPLARQLCVDKTNGQLYLPMNRSVSRLYFFNPQTDELFTPAGLDVTVRGITEGNSTVEPGDPRLCVDGRVGEGFTRKVYLPPEDDQREVTMDVTIAVPSTFATEANLLTLLPSPAGQVDVLNIWYSGSDNDPTTVLRVYDKTGAISDFAAVQEVTSLQLHFEPVAIAKLKVRLRQRHWVTENNERAFLYGLREVHLDLVEWDRQTLQSAFKQSNSAFFKIDAPTGYKFKTLKDLRSVPTVTQLNNKIVFEIFGNSNMTSNELWDSQNNVALSSTPVSVATHNLTSIYVGVKATYDTSLGMSPVLKNFFLRYEVQSV